RSASLARAPTSLRSAVCARVRSPALRHVREWSPKRSASAAPQSRHSRACGASCIPSRNRTATVSSAGDIQRSSGALCAP
ncbi:hypothetical protein DIPPA_09276, partial [Diplonema papillatum]